MNSGRAGWVLRSVVAAVLAGGWLLLFFNRGLYPNDDVAFLDIGGRMVHGEMPYRDFVLPESAGHYYLFAGLEALFGEKLLPTRIAWWVAGILMAIAIAELVAHRLPPALAGIAGACAVIGSMPVLSCLSYYWTANLVGVWALVFVLRSHEGGSTRRLWTAGALGTLAFLLKQSAGAYVSVGLALATLLVPTPDGAGPVRRLTRLVLGAFAALGVVHTVFLSIGFPIRAYWSWIVVFFRYPQPGLEVILPSPWACVPQRLTGEALGNAILNCTFYLPILSVAVTILREWRPRSRRNPLTLAVGVYGLLMLLHLTPRAKWAYFVKALPVPLALLFVAVFVAASRRSRFARLGLGAFLLAVMGVLISREFDYHSGEDFPLDGPFAGIYATRQDRDHLLAMKAAVAPLLGPQDTLLVLPSDTSLYAYLGRPSRFRLHYLFEGDLFLTLMMEDLERVKPRVFLLGPTEPHFPGFPGVARPLIERIHRTYHRAGEVDGTEIWLRD